MELARDAKIEKWLNLLILVTMVVALFFNVGINALYLEEPRRAMIALEMDQQDDLIVPTYYGEYYYRKPPIFNWAILGSYRLFGVTEWATRLVSVLSVLLWAGVNFLFVRRYGSKDLAQFSSLLLICAPILLYFMSFMAEIDDFYCLISYSSIVVYYHFYRQNQPWGMFLGLYGLSALGLLTKGLPSVVFGGMTILGFLAWKKNWRQIFSWAHLTGILTFCGIVGSFLWAYHQQHDVLNYFEGLWGQASDQTVLNEEKHGLIRFLQHLVTQPLNNAGSIGIAAAFLLLGFRKGALKRLFADDLMAFCGVAWLANIPVYWLSPGSKPVYNMMLDPFLIILGVQLLLNEGPELKWINAGFKVLNPFILVVVTFSMLVIPFIPFFAPIQEYFWACFVIALVALTCLLAWFRWRGFHLHWLVIGLLLSRVAFDAVVLPMRVWDGQHTRFKEDSEQIVARSGTDHVRIWKYRDEGTFAHHFAFYIERGKGEVLRFVEEKNCEDYFLSPMRDVNPGEVEVVYRFVNWNHDYVMFKFKDCAS